ncbi:MAG: glycerol kinase GlpK [Chitinophagales bacterium]|nr:glycerol kinase GlpK [Chitinophagales bacterium]
MKKYILALDEGTTSARSVLFDDSANVCGTSQKEFVQYFPTPGWVEHDAEEIWNTQLESIYEVISSSNITAYDIAAIGIANQRETTVIWNRKTGKPVYKAIVWQDRRTSGICDALKAKGYSEIVKEKTGLVIDAYFSATKIKWILDHVENAQQLAINNELAFGTIDSWLIWKLTGGKVHATDFSNASRTMLFNINTLKWDEELLNELNIPASILPEVKNTSSLFGYTDMKIFGVKIPVTSAAGDQQAALFGHRCFETGMAKNTYGTGCFMLMNTGRKKVSSASGLLTTIAWKIDDSVEYALEGSVFIGGAAIQWMRDGLQLLSSSAESSIAALKVADNGGVVVVPAFTGLGAPYWDMYARGAIFGLSLGTTANHLIRATLESIAYQTYDVINAMEKDSSIGLHQLRVDGGACENNFLMQFQSDILNVIVARPAMREATALGAAYLAGLAVGFFNKEKILSHNNNDNVFSPEMNENERDQLLNQWHKAIERAKGWDS